MSPNARPEPIDKRWIIPLAAAWLIPFLFLNFWRTVVLLVVLSVTGAGWSVSPAQATPQVRRQPAGVSNLTLTSPAFASGTEFPVKYAAARDAAPLFPKLEWTGVPEGTVSFVLIFHDPDAALNKTLDDYLHWLVFNIPGNVRELPEGMPPTPKLADGTIQAKTRGNIIGYTGPGAAANGPVHHYTFELYALDTML